MRTATRRAALADRPKPVPPKRMAAWRSRVAGLLDQLAGWSSAEGWTVRRDVKEDDEAPVYLRKAAALLIQSSAGDLFITVADPSAYGDGWMTVEASPTFSRVRLLPEAEGWQVMTESNVPLRVPWNRESFVQLAHDLLA